MKLRPERKLCTECRCHRAVSFASGRVAWRRDHPLCPACFRAVCDAVHARALAAHLLTSITLVSRAA